MNNWQEIYKSRLTTADEAVKHIPNNCRVFFGHAANEPPVLVDALVKNYMQYENVEICHWVPMGKGEYTKPEMAGHFRYNGLFLGGVTRKCVEEGRGDYTPFNYHQSTRFFSDGTFPIDVALVSVTPPDKNGYVNLGVSVGGTLPACKNAKLVIAQVNENMPRTMGDGFLKVSEIDYFVEANTPLPEGGAGVITPELDNIAKYIADLVEDGSTLQLGIGAIPDAVLASLKNHKHLGIHSEMIADGVLDLVETGVIDCSEKTLHRGQIVVTFLMGTKRLYDFADRNPMLMLRPVDYVNDPTVIAKNNKMVSINSALQVDFMGQVVAASIGTRQFSGVGGQVDFVRGASRAEDGKGISIIAMPSIVTKKDGTIISKIVPYIDPGAAVTTNRYDVDYIITEYGIARMKGKTLRERARALINIAHPSVVDDLSKAFEERFNTPYVEE